VYVHGNKGIKGANVSFKAKFRRLGMSNDDIYLAYCSIFLLHIKLMIHEKNGIKGSNMLVLKQYLDDFTHAQ
jgi:hypothetical protein